MEKRKLILEPLMAEDTHKDMGELLTAIRKLVAALKVVLKPGPVPNSTVFGVALYAIDGLVWE